MIRTLFLMILFLANIQTVFADTPITSFQTYGDIEISALGRYGIRLCQKQSVDCSFFYKESPSENHYSEGLCERMDNNGLPSLLYRNALLVNNQLIVVVDTFQNETFISTTVDIVDPNTGAIAYSFEWPEIRHLSIIQEGNEKLVVILSANEIEILKTDFKSHAEKVHAIPLPEGIFQECVFSHSYRSSRLTENQLTKETERRYLIFNSSEGELSLWKISGPLLKADSMHFISGIAANDRTYHISLEPSEEKSEPEESVSDNNKFSSVLANNEIKTESLRELLHRTISEKNRADLERAEAHRWKMEEYQASLRYASVKTYEAADSFFRTFIPFDDDLIPTLFNCYVTETNAKKMLECDLRVWGLLEGLRKEEGETISQGLSNARFYGDRAGLSVLLFPAAKMRSIYSTYRKGDSLLPEKLSLVTRSRERATRLCQPSTRRDHYEQFYKRYASQPILLRIARDYAPFVGRRYNTNILKMFPKIMITTNLVWGLTELYRQVKDHGWEIAEWNEGQITYNAIFLNVLTTAVVIISGYRVNHIWRTVAVVGVIDGLSPIAQAVENRVIHDDPNRPYDYAQVAFDKLFLAGFALPKSQANVYFQPKATAALREQGYGRWAHEYAVPYGMNTINEALGTGGYTLTVPAGNDFLKELILPAVEFDQNDFENFLKGR